MSHLHLLHVQHIGCIAIRSTPCARLSVAGSEQPVPRVPATLHRLHHLGLLLRGVRHRRPAATRCGRRRRAAATAAAAEEEGRDVLAHRCRQRVE